jgi:DNA-binding MarR family transcriptional regulator
VPQYSALYLIDQSPGISGAALARHSLVTAQTMATVLRNLGTLGLIDRRAHAWHRNVVETTLTDAGKRALAIADDAASEIERRLAEHFSPAERDTLRDLLRRCSEQLKLSVSDAPAGQVSARHD